MAKNLRSNPGDDNRSIVSSRAERYKQWERKKSYDVEDLTSNDADDDDEEYNVDDDGDDKNGEEYNVVVCGGGDDDSRPSPPKLMLMECHTMKYATFAKFIVTRLG